MGQNFLEIALSGSVSEINLFCANAEIQDGRQKWRKNDFGKKLNYDLHGFDIVQPYQSDLVHLCEDLRLLPF